MPALLPSREALHAAAHSQWAAGRNLAIFGEPGSGRSIFAERVLGSSPGPMHRFTGTPVLKDVPFAALAAMTASAPVGSAGSLSPTQLIAALAAREPEAAQRTLVLDGAEFIDDASAAALAQSVTDSGLRIIMVSTAANKLSAPLRALALRCEAIVLPPLTDADSMAIVTEILGTPVTFDTAQWLAEASGRNTQFLRELVIDAHESGGFHEVGGHTTLKEGWRPQGRRISEFVAVRLAHQSEPVKTAVELIAITGEISRDLAVELVGSAAIKSAIAADLLETSVIASEPDCAPEHIVVRMGAGLTSQTVIAARPASELRCHAEHALRFFEKMPLQARISVARHAVRVGVELPEGVREAIVGEALRAREFDAVLQLAGESPRPGESEPTILARSRALFESGRAEQALAALDSLVDRSQPARMWAATVLAAAGRISEAEALLQSRPDDDPARNPELIARRDLLRARATGEVPLATLRGHASNGDLHADLRASALQSALLAEVLAGSALEVIAEITSMMSTPEWEQIPTTGQVELLVTLFFAAVASGSAHNDVGDVGLAGWIALRIPPGLFLGAGGISRLESGDAATAANLLSQALVALGEENRFGMTAYFAAAAAYASALLGDVEGAVEHRQTALASLSEGSPLNAESERMLLAGQGLHTGAAAVAVRWNENVRRAHDSGRRYVHMRLLHDGWRLGLHDDPSMLAKAARRVQGALAEALTDYPAALTGDDDALGRALEAHRSAGHTLFAAELAQSSLRWARNGRRKRPVSPLVSEALKGLIDLPGVDTPILGRTRIDEAVLSEREFDICTRALRGLTSQEIAQDLYLSARTVEGHLQRAFGKLGIAGRPQLAPPRVGRSTV